MSVGDLQHRLSVWGGQSCLQIQTVFPIQVTYCRVRGLLLTFGLYIHSLFNCRHCKQTGRSFEHYNTRVRWAKACKCSIQEGTYSWLAQAAFVTLFEWSDFNSCVFICQLSFRPINTYSKWVGITSASHLYRGKLDILYLVSNGLWLCHTTAVICINI